MSIRWYLAAAVGLVLLAGMPVAGEATQAASSVPSPAVSPTAAPTPTDALSAFGLTPQQADAFEAVADGLEADQQAAIDELIDTFTLEGAGQPLPGSLRGSTYTDPNGFSITVPEGWALLEQLVGPAIVMTAPVDAAAESSAQPVSSIAVVGTSVDIGDLSTVTEAQISEMLTTSLPNAQLIALEEFDYMDGKARELVCMYGEEEDTMLMQYQTFFKNEGRSYLITMTTLAEEAVHDIALEAYDAVLASFTIDVGGQGNG